MNKNENYTDLIELLNMIIEDDISIKELLSKKNEIRFNIKRGDY